MQTTENLILGLDIGLSSIAWALIDPVMQKVIDGGLFFFDDPQSPTNADRQSYKSKRKQYKRRKRRRKIVRGILFAHDMFPVKVTDMKNVLRYWDQSKTSREDLTEPARQYRAFCDMEPWDLRTKAIKGEKLTLEEIGRICYHFAHQRGFNEKMLSLDKEDAKVLKKGKPTEDKIGTEATQRAIEKGKKYPFLGYYLTTLFPVKKEPYQLKERIRNRHTYRSMYIAEFEHIWQTQKKYYPDQLSDTLYKKLHHHLFFQLPLQQPPKGRCRLEPNKPRALKASLLFERFQLHKFLNNLRINDEELTSSTRKIVTAFYHKKSLNKTPKFTIEELKEHLRKKEPFEKHYINFKPKEMITTAPLTSQLTDIFTAKVWEALTEKEKTDRWHIIVDNHKYNADFLQAYAEKKWSLSAKALEKLAKIRIPAGVAKLSEKALRYIVPYLEEGFTEDKALLLGSVKKAFGHHFGEEEKAGQPNHWKALSSEEKETIESACIDIVENHDSGHLEKVKSYLKAHYPTRAYALDKIYAHTNLYTTQPQNKLDAPVLTRNPLVNKALYALRPTINALIKRHNLAYIPYVHVEMARELKKSEAEREAIANRQRKQEQTNDLFYAELRALGANTNNKDNFIKYALWIECDRKCVYTGNTIGIKDLFELGNYEIEHIIPRTPKDSRMENLTLCERRKNQEKGGRTPYQAFGHTHEWEMMKAYARKCLPFRKYQRFISEKEPRESYEMTQKDLSLTGYIAKEVAAYLRQVSGNIYFTKGGITALLRQQWGLDTLLAPPIPMPDKDSFHEIVTSQDPSPSYLPGRYYIALKEDNEVIAYTPYNPALTGRSFEEIQKDLKEVYTDKKHAKSKEKNAQGKAEKDVVKEEIKQIDGHIKDLYKELGEAQKKTQKERESIFKITNGTTQSGSLPAMVQSVFQELYPTKTTWPKFYVLSGEIHVEDAYGKPIPPTFIPDESKNRSDHRHHIVDALVIAATRLADTQAYNRKSSLGATYNTLQEVVVPLPWNEFKDDAEALLSQVFMYRRPAKEPLQEKVKKKVKVPIYPDPLASRPQKKHRWVVAQGDSARGELHNETYYGKCKSPEGKVGYHNRKNIEEIKSPKQVAKVVDKAIREKMYELIEQTGGKITKDTFYDIEYIIKKNRKEFVKRTPKLYLPNKRENGQPVPVKKVRISEQLSKATQLSPSYNRWVNPSGNHLSGIYRLKDGSWKDYVYTLKEAIDLGKRQTHDTFPPTTRTFEVKVKRGKEPVLEEAPLVLTLQRNNLVMLDPPAFLREESTFNLNLLNQSQLAAISESTYRLQKLSQKENTSTGIRESGSYVFRKHMAATIDIPMQSVTIVPSSLQKLYPIKVIVDSLGKICQLIDPIRQRKWSIE